MSEVVKGALCPLLPPEAVSGLENNVLLDVRSALEFESEHIDGALNVPLDQLESRMEQVPRQENLVLVCRSGKRAERGALMLMQKGYSPKVLQGGMLAWQQAGLPVKRGRKTLSLERQIQLVVGLGVLTGTVLGLSVNPAFFAVPVIFGCGLTFAGATGTCGLGILLSKAPWNKLPCNSSACASDAQRDNCGV